MLPSVPAQWTGGLACILLGALALALRSAASGRHRVRVKQLERSAELLETHALALGAFLDAPTAPKSLKRVALEVALFMDDRDAVRDFAAWAAAQPLGETVSDGDTLDIVQAVQLLRHEQPGLAACFSSALVCGTFGAILRWPDSARLFDVSVPAVVASGTREIAAAMRAARMRGHAVSDKGGLPELAAC